MAIKDKWGAYSRHMILLGMPEQALSAMKKVFFMGSSAAVEILSEYVHKTHAENEALDKEELIDVQATVDALIDEINAFTANPDVGGNIITLPQRKKMVLQ